MLLKTKLTNRLKTVFTEDEIRIKLQNISINGTKRGCSGHITHCKTGKCVYVNTEPLITDPKKVMWRYAADDRDFSSNRLGVNGSNHFTTEDRLVEEIHKVLSVS